MKTDQERHADRLAEWKAKPWQSFGYCEICPHRADMHDMNCIECCPVTRDGVDANRKQNPPPPEPGMWTLIGPDGKRYKAETPLKCAAKEQRERIPADVALARVRAALADVTPFDQATCRVGGGKCECTNHCKQLD